MLIMYDGPPTSHRVPVALPQPVEDSSIAGLGWNIAKHVSPSPGCVNCVGGVRGLRETNGGISSGLTILGLLAVAAIALTVVNLSKK